LEESGREHVERAVALALEGRQGSSMAEFLLALRAGYEVDVADLDREFRLSPAALIALSRAQMAAGGPAPAKRTLQYAVLAFPADRLLKLALFQLPGD
jgi:hypothetical protein